MTQPNEIDTRTKALTEFFNELAKIDGTVPPTVTDGISVEDAQNMATMRLMHLQNMGLLEIQKGNMDEAMRIAEATTKATLTLMARYGVLDIIVIRDPSTEISSENPSETPVDPKSLN